MRDRVARIATLADAAIELLGEEGARGLTHRAVDARAGLPAGTTSAYLRTRKALIEAVVARLAQLDGPPVPPPGGADPDALAAGIAVLLDHQLGAGRTRTLARYACLLEATHQPELRTILAHGDASRAGARELLTAAGAPDPELRAGRLVAFLDGLLFDRLAGAGALTAPRPGTPESLADLTDAIRLALTAAIQPEGTSTAATRPEGAPTAATRPEGTATAAIRPEGAETAAPRPESAETAAMRPEGAGTDATRRHVMGASDAVALLTALDGLHVRLSGGWAVDALLREQTREHSDLDLWLPAEQLHELFVALARHGVDRILPVPGDRPWNFVLHDGGRLRVDLHLYETLPTGELRLGDATFPAAALAGEGVIAGLPVRCEAPEWAVRWHTGYPPRDRDRHDVPRLCDRFGLDRPEGF